MARFIGIRHRVKLTRRGEARPTMVAILEGDQVVTRELEDETAELDFLLHRFPVAWREPNFNEDLSTIHGDRQQWLYHCKTRKLKEGDPPIENRHPSHFFTVGRTTHLVTKVPSAYDGLTAGDTVGMSLGGSGDRFAYALSRRAEELGEGTAVLRLTPMLLMQQRGAADKDDDHLLLASLVQQQRGLFYEMTPRDRQYILAREAMRYRTYTQKDRIRCDQRLIARALGAVFLSEEGRYPEGRIEDQYDALRANDSAFQALMAEEQLRERELRAAVRQLDVWQQVFEPIEGCGEVLAAAMITAIVTVRRFEVPPDYTGCQTELDRQLARRRARNKSRAKLKAYLGAHVLNGGKYGEVPEERQFPRLRAGAVANWQNEGRQGLFLLADQFVKRPGSSWREKLDGFKANQRAAHPVEVVVEGKRRYTPGHLHRRAIWRTITRFVERLYDRWIALERQAAAGD